MGEVMDCMDMSIPLITQSVIWYELLPIVATAFSMWQDYIYAHHFYFHIQRRHFCKRFWQRILCYLAFASAIQLVELLF